MMKKFTVYCLVLLMGCASADSCTELCKKDGPAVCTKGSWTEKGFCRYYLVKADGGVCYHTTETASTCQGKPLKVEDVGKFLATNNNANGRKSGLAVETTVGPTEEFEGERKSSTPVPPKPREHVRPVRGFHAIERGPAKGLEHKYTVFLLHGKDGKPEHMFALGEGSWMRNLPAGTKFVSLGAPGGHWFDVLCSNPLQMGMMMMANQEVVVRPSLEANMQTLVGMIDAEAALVGGHHNVFLIGYSMGGMLSVYTGLMGGRPLGGVAIMNSAVPVVSLDGIPGEGRDLPIVHFHGENDKIVPVMMAERGHLLAVHAGARNYELRKAPGSHDPSTGVTRSLTEWILTHMH
jgi:predicted esterase